MVSCDWTGTMNLTSRIAAPSGPDAHQGGAAGRTAATITGQKIFISAGEHDWPITLSTCAGQDPRRRRGHQGHFALHRAEVPG